MKNKYFLLIILVAVVIIIESLILLTGGVLPKKSPSADITTEAVSFSWRNETQPVLLMKANKDLSLDAIDLYLAYSGVVVNSATNMGDLPKPSFMKVSTEKSLVVLNYLISEPEGLAMKQGQEIEVLSLDIKEGVTDYEISVSPKTQVVENGTSKVLPFNNQSLIVKSTR